MTPTAALRCLALLLPALASCTSGTGGRTAPPTDSGTVTVPDPSPTSAADPADHPDVYFPGGEITVRLVGLHRLLPPAEAFVVFERHSRPVPGAPDRWELRKVTRDGPSLAEVAQVGEERLVVEARDGFLRTGLAPGRLREVPPPAPELPIPPEVGRSWQVEGPAVRASCTVESVEEAATFAGPQPGCVVVRIRDADGLRTHRLWYHPTRGLVRGEARDRTGRLLLGYAVCGERLPTEAAVRKMFPAAAAK